VIGFVTTNKITPIDYYLTQLNLDLTPFDTLSLEPAF